GAPFHELPNGVSRAARFAARTGAYCASRSASTASGRIFGSASKPCRTILLLSTAGAARNSAAEVSTDPITPPMIAAAKGDDRLPSLTDLSSLSRRTVCLFSRVRHARPWRYLEREGSPDFLA